MGFFDEIVVKTEKQLRQLEDEAYNKMRENVGVKSGALRDAIVKERHENYTDIVVDSEKLIADPRNKYHVDYSLWHHDGHGGFYLRPKNAKALSWIDPKSGKRRFSKGHWIPPYPGNPFVSDTYKYLKSRGW